MTQVMTHERDPHGLFHPQDLKLKNVFATLEAEQKAPKTSKQLCSCLRDIGDKKKTKLGGGEDVVKDVKLCKMMAQLHFAQKSLLSLPRGRRAASREKEKADKLEELIASYKKGCDVELPVLSPEEAESRKEQKKLMEYLESKQGRRRDAVACSPEFLEEMKEQKEYLESERKEQKNLKEYLESKQGRRDAVQS